MTNKDIIKQYVNTGVFIGEYQFNKLNNNLKKSYLRKRSQIGDVIASFEWLAFNKNEIKSAIENNGFDDIIIGRDANFLSKLEGITFDVENSLNIDGITIFPKNITFNNNGSVDLNYAREIEDCYFNNKGDVFLQNVRKMKIKKFNNKGLINLDNLSEILCDTTFNNDGGIYMDDIKSFGEFKVIFDNNGDVRLFNLSELSVKTEFNNKGDIYFSNLEKAPVKMIFNNKGFVSLYDITFDENVKYDIRFDNGGDVMLDSVEYLPEGIVFNNGGKIRFHSGFDYYKLSKNQLKMIVPRLPENIKLLRKYDDIFAEFR
jgi:hypothetical protein